MTMALSCEGDSDNVGGSSNNHDPNRTWLEMKKEQNAAAAVPVSIRENLAEAFDKFCAESTVAEGTNSFKWWAMNKTRYPNVAVVARQYLAIPATSVASERLFSKCGLVCSDRRAALNPQHLKQPVVLSQNLNN